MRKQILAPLPNNDPLVAVWLSAFQDTRRRTLRTLEGLEPNVIDWLPPWGGNAISALLYHLASIEADWLYTDILEQREFPQLINELFPYDVHDSDGNLTVIPKVALETHLERLTIMRENFMNTMRAITGEDFRRVRSFPDYQVTPEWVIHHLMQHEAENRGQIMGIREAYQHRNPAE